MFKKKPLSEEQIAEYLREHPDFFEAQAQLLGEINIGHDSGGAVSLVERQVSVLRERNQEMRERLSELIANARDNDRLFEKTKALILSLVAEQDIESLQQRFEQQLLKDFDVDFARLIVFGTPTRLGSEVKTVSLERAMEHIGGLVKSGKSVCGHLREDELQFLFDQNAEQVGSAAVVPLSASKHGQAIGVIAIASKDPEHFRSSMGTLFLDYVAEVLNRLVPQHLDNAA